MLRYARWAQPSLLMQSSVFPPSPPQPPLTWALCMSSGLHVLMHLSVYTSPCLLSSPVERWEEQGSPTQVTRQNSFGVCREVRRWEFTSAWCPNPPPWLLTLTFTRHLWERQMGRKGEDVVEQREEELKEIVTCTFVWFSFDEVGI